MLRYGAYKLLRWQYRQQIETALISRDNLHDAYMHICDYVIWKYRGHRTFALMLEISKHGKLNCQVVYANDVYAYCAVQVCNTVHITYFEWGKPVWVTDVQTRGCMLYLVERSIESCQLLYPYWLKSVSK